MGLCAPDIVTQCGQITELSLRFGHRVGVAHAESANVRGSGIEVKPQLVVKVLLEARSAPWQPEDAPNAWRDLSREERHGSRLVGLEHP
jgi:hypothetical protein